MQDIQIEYANKVHALVQGVDFCSTEFLAVFGQESGGNHTFEALFNVTVVVDLRAGGECFIHELTIRLGQVHDRLPRNEYITVILVHLVKQVLLGEHEENGRIWAHFSDLLHPSVEGIEAFGRADRHAQEEAVRILVMLLPIGAKVRIAGRIANFDRNLFVVDHFLALVQVEHRRLVVLLEFVLGVVDNQARLAN